MLAETGEDYLEENAAPEAPRRVAAPAAPAEGSPEDVLQEIVFTEKEQKEVGTSLLSLYSSRKEAQHLGKQHDHDEAVNSSCMARSPVSISGQRDS